MPNPLLTRRIVLPRGSGYDADAAAFFAAASITDGAQKSAVNQLVLDLKGFGIWSQWHVLRPYVGAAETPHRYNLRNPATFLSSFNAVSHGTDGITGNGSSAYENCAWATSDTGLDDVTLYCYCRTASDVANGMLLGVAGTNKRAHIRLGTFAQFGGLNNDTTAAATVLAGAGHYFAVRSGASSQVFATPQFGESSDTGASISTNASPIYALARHFTGFPNGDTFSNANLAFTAFGPALDATQRANFRTAITAFQTTLGRNV